MKPIMIQATLVIVAVVVAGSDAMAQRAAVGAQRGAAVIGPGGAAARRSKRRRGDRTLRGRRKPLAFGRRLRTAWRRNHPPQRRRGRRSARGCGIWLSGGTYTTQRGTTVTYGKAGAAAAGPYGTRVGGVGGVRVETARGQTYTKTSRGGAAVGPSGSAAGRSSSAAVTGPYGAAGANHN